MENLQQTQQLIVDLRHAKEADAHRYRLVKRDRIPARLSVPAFAWHHGIAANGRQTLARS